MVLKLAIEEVSPINKFREWNCIFWLLNSPQLELCDNGFTAGLCSSSELDHSSWNGVINVHFSLVFLMPVTLFKVSRHLKILRILCTKWVQGKSFLVFSRMGGQDFYNLQYSLGADSPTLCSPWKFLKCGKIQEFTVLQHILEPDSN